MRKLISIFLIILISLTAAACGRKNTRYEAQFLELFDTMSTLIIYAPNKAKSQEISQFIYDELKKYHQLYDIYNDYSGINNIKTINDQAGKAPVVVDRKIIDLLLFAREAYAITKGKVNVAFGPVLKLWHDYRTAGIDDPETAQLPPLDKLQAASQHCDINKVIIDEAASTVYLEDPQMRLDVGAVAKGYATEQVCRAAQNQGIENVLVSIGGNVRAIGSKEGDFWKVGIQNPGNVEDESIPLLFFKGMSLVTSGTYERFYTVNGKNYHHIINPDTLYPAEYYTSVSILCKDSGMADALSTAVFNMPYEEGQALVESLPDTEAMWVFANGAIKKSSGFDNYTKPN